MTHATLFACSLCQASSEKIAQAGLSGGEYLIRQLEAELAEKNLQDQIQLRPVRCMASCSQACNVTLAGANRLTFILSGLSPTDSSSRLSEFCQQYIASANGKVPYRERSPLIREATAFVLPPLPSAI